MSPSPGLCAAGEGTPGTESTFIIYIREGDVEGTKGGAKLCMEVEEEKGREMRKTGQGKKKWERGG